MVSDTVSTSGLSQTSTGPQWEHFVERPRPGAWADALDTKVVAEGEGPAEGEEPARRDFRVLLWLRLLGGCPEGTRGFGQGRHLQTGDIPHWEEQWALDPSMAR